MKANSTDITITNSRFYNGLGIAIGSIGQYKGQFETVERVRVGNITYKNTLHAVSFYRPLLTEISIHDIDLQVYFKTWTADQNGYPPNGGGGGLGCESTTSSTENRR